MAMYLAEVCYPTIRVRDGGKWFQFQPDKHSWVNLSAPPNSMIISMLDKIKALAPSYKNPDELDKWLRSCRSYNKIKNIWALAKIELTDNSPWVPRAYHLACRSGVIDLRDGSVRPGRPEDHLCSYIDLDYRPGLTCERWDRFLSEIMCDNQEDVEYLKMALGYTMTGETDQHLFFVLHGDGANGKSVLINTMHTLLGPYSQLASPACFLANQSGNRETALAQLQYARLIHSGESAVGSRLSEDSLKSFVHADQLVARHLYCQEFTYRPIGKLWLAVNHCPEVNDQSSGVWRSMVKIPFDASFLDSPDLGLEKKLVSNSEAIFSTLVDYSRAYYANPVSLRQKTKRIEESTEDQRDESDNWRQFFGEECEDERGMVMPSVTPFSTIYGRYMLWCGRNGIREPQTRTTIGRRLGKDFERRKDISGARHYSGIRMRPINQPDV